MSDPTERQSREWMQDADTVFELLADARRRAVLATLVETDEPCDLDQLTDAVVERDSELTTADREQVRVSLHHVHLPKLASASVVEYDDGVVNPVDLSSVETIMSRVGLSDA